MASLMLGSDVAISAAGQTLNELACLGVPTVAVCIDEDQRPNYEAYLRAGCLTREISWDDRRLERRIADALKDMEGGAVRRHVSRMGQSIIDGKGVERLSKLLDLREDTA